MGKYSFGFLDENDPEDKKLLDRIIPPPYNVNPMFGYKFQYPDEFQKLVNLILVLQQELKLMFVM
jgi:hypothetical protein